MFSQIVVKGHVVDQVNMSLPGVGISLKNTSIGYVTDFNGGFSIELPTGDATLIFSSLGYKSQSIEINESKTALFIVLEEDVNQLEDVVITANRITQSSQKVAQSVSVLNLKKIQRARYKEFRDYASGISNLSFGSQGGDGGGRFSNEITIRGINGNNTTAMYLNNTPLPENINPNLIDVSRIEVLKGPQGTLYGASSMGGAIKVISEKPNVNLLSGFLENEIANVKEGHLDYNIQGVLNLPITNKLALRTSGFYNFQSGIYDRLVNKNIKWLNESEVLIEDFYEDTEDYFGTPFAIRTNGCNGCSRKDKENVDDKYSYGINTNIGVFPRDNMSIIATVIHQKLKGDGYDFAEVDVDNFIQNSNTGLDEKFEDAWTNYSLNTTFTTNKGTITSSTSFLDRAYVETEDHSDITTYYWIAYDDEPGEVPLESIWGSTTDRGVATDLFQQEIRFNSNFQGKYNFIAGLFFSNQKEVWFYKDEAKGLATYLLSDNSLFEDALWGETENDYKFILNNNDLPWYAYDGSFKNSEFALFGQFYYDITAKLKLTFGLRYFNVKSKHEVIENGADIGFVNISFLSSFSERGVNPKFNLTYSINEDKLFYGTMTKGVRVGDSNEILPLVAQNDIYELGGEFVRSYESDFLWNYELGYKSVWAEGKIIANISLFYNKWNNLQQYRLLPSGWGYTSNVGSAHTSGLEVEFRNKLSQDFEFGLGLGLLDARIDEGSETLTASKGDRILNSPSTTANINAEYSKVLGEESSMYISSELQYVGKRFGTYEPKVEPELVFLQYALLNARIGYLFSNMELALFGKNLTNKQANFGSIQSFGGILPGRQRYSTNRPITIGLSYKYKF